MSSPGQPSGISSFLNGIAAPETTSSSTQYPLWLQQAIESIAGAAGNLAQQPYQQFPGPTVAAPSQQTQEAWKTAGTNVGNYQPALNQASALTQASAAPITASDISTFLNPYESYVTGALNRNLTDNILPAVQDKFVSAGQSRSPQEAQLTGQAIYGTQQAAGQSLAGAYQGALDSLMRQRQQQGSAGAALGQLGALTQQLGATDVGQLAAAGNAQDVIAQSNINAALNQFQQQQQYPYQQLGFLSDIINRVPIQATGQTTTSVQSGNVFAPSPLATFAGTLAGGNSVGLARGGRVVPMRRRVMGALEHCRMAA
jgi:hypothetical protein